MNFLKKLLKPQQNKTGIIYLVEDNAMYAKTLSAHIQSNFPEVRDVKIFPVGETCLMALKNNPDLVIIDYYLDSTYYDAQTGLEIIQEMRKQKPDLNIIVLSSQTDVNVVLDAVQKYSCTYIKKDHDAFERNAEVIREN